MEILSYNSSLCGRVAELRSKSADKISNTKRLKVARNARCSLLFLRMEFGNGSLRHSTVQQSGLNNLRSPRISNLNVSSGIYHGYVIGTEEDASTTSEVAVISKVTIPGSPDEPSGEFGAPISSCFWEWKPKLSVHYEKAGCDNVKSPPVLFLPGFGVGSFHYEKQLKDLGHDFRVWALDFLGQGMSLPCEDPTPQLKGEREGAEIKDVVWGFGEEVETWANDLVYSMDLWQDQVRYFVEEVIGEPVYVVGNSLGGYVALYFAACNPHLVKGVTLLNATPFWGFLPNPIRSPRLAKYFPWAGTFPLPARVRKLTKLVWQKISDPRSIAEVLKQVYVDHSMNIDKIFSCILETTQHPAAAASFASIMFAPQAQLSFSEALSRCKDLNVPVCLMYGKEDPWVKPVWGLQVKRQIPNAPYYEISPAGHCPHDEVPEVVNYLLRQWIKSLEAEGSISLPLLDDSAAPQHSILRDLEFVRDGVKKTVKVRFVGSSLLIWRTISSFIKSYFGRDEFKS